MSCLGKVCKVQHRNPDCRGGRHAKEIIALEAKITSLENEMAIYRKGSEKEYLRLERDQLQGYLRDKTLLADQLRAALEATLNPFFHGQDCEEDASEPDGWYCECHIGVAQATLRRIDG